MIRRMLTIAAGLGLLIGWLIAVQPNRAGHEIRPPLEPLDDYPTSVVQYGQRQ